MEDKDKLPTTCGECKYFRVNELVNWQGVCEHPDMRWDRHQIGFDRSNVCPLVRYHGDGIIGLRLDFDSICPSCGKKYREHNK